MNGEKLVHRLWQGEYREAPAVVKINEKYYMLIFNQMRTKFFGYREKEWFDFVINNRLDLDFITSHKIVNHNKDNKYDIVYGEIADGKIAELANNIKKSICDIDSIDYTYILPETGKFYGNQYSFHTEKSLSCKKIYILCYDKIIQRRKKVELI